MRIYSGIGRFNMDNFSLPRPGRAWPETAAAGTGNRPGNVPDIDIRGISIFSNTAGGKPWQV
jgi:hypothetical protein